MNSEDTTAISVACQEGHYDIVEILLEFNADLHIANANNLTPLFCAASQVGNFLGHRLPSKGFSKIVSLLLSHGAYADHKTPDGCTALYTAAQKGYADVSVI